MDREELERHLHATTTRERRILAGIDDGLGDMPFEVRSVGGKDTLYVRTEQMFTNHPGEFLSVKRNARYQEFPEHCHDGVEINYMYEGSSEQIINGRSHTIGKEQLVFMSPDTVHTIRPLGEGDILININLNMKYLTTHFLNRISCDSVLTRFLTDALVDSIRRDDFLILDTAGDERLRCYMEDLLCEWYDPSPMARDVMESLFSLIASRLVLAYKSSDGPDEHGSGTSVVPILAYIEQNYLTCTLDEVADRFGLNPNYLSNLLKKRVGMSYRGVVQMQRLNNAERLLRSSNVSVSEAARLSGYENMTFFYKKFAEKNGCSPAEYRERAAV